ncbi:MAG: hypothetical protein K9N49_08140 [Candidatus Marinimicrobia bacterium]|nr:hypothetical protein [Candidatus Neomarinimicrobiota bacterium]
MSAAGKLDGLKQAYDRLFLLVALILLLLSCGWLLTRLASHAGGPPPMAAQTEPTLEPLEVTALAERIERLAAPVTTPVRTQQLLTSELRVACINPECAKPILFHAKQCPFCQTEQPEIRDIDTIDSSGDGIPDVMKIKHGLDPYSSQDAFEDLDSDGFLNIEEFCLETRQWLSDPTDPASFPPPIVKLRLARIMSEPFTLRFKGVQRIGEDERLFQLNLLSDQSYFARMDQSITVTNPRTQAQEVYTIKAYEFLEQETPRGKRDVSVLTISRDGRDIRLVKDRPLTEYERSARLVFLIDRRPFTVRVNDEIELMEHRYKVVDIRADSVLVRDVDSGVDSLVTRLSEADLRQLRGETEDPAMGMMSPEEAEMMERPMAPRGRPVPLRRPVEDVPPEW